MASLIRSGSILKIFSGFRRFWTTSVPPSDALILQKTQTALLHSSITRPLAAQRPIENVRGSQTSFQGIDKALVRIDTDIKRTGRIYLRDIEEIFKEIKTLKHASSLQSLLLLRCCGSLVPEERPEVRNKLVQEIWNTLHELQVSLDISHYNTLLRVYLENDHKFSPTQFLADLEKHGIEPNRVTYQRLIARYCQDGDIEGATRILEFMKEKQLPVGENIFHALIMGHARSNDLESAHGVLEVMRSSGLDPTTETFTTLLTSYAEAGDMAGIEATLEECKKADLTLHDRELMEAMFALANGGHVTGFMQMMERLQKGQGYNQDAMNLIYRLLNIDCHQMAYLMFQSMAVPRSIQGEAGPMGAFFIKHLVRCGTDIPTTVHYCHELKKEGLNAMPLETALGAALIGGQPEAALALMRVMLEDGLEIRTHYFWPIIVHYAKLKDANNIYKTVEEMVTMETPLTLETFRTYVVPSLAECGVTDEDTLITALRKIGLSLPLVVNSLVAYHLDNKDLEAAASVVKRCRTRVKTILRREVAVMYVKSGNAADAVAILGQMTLNQEEVSNEDKEAEEEDKQEDEGEVGEGRAGGDTRGVDVAGMFLVDVLFQSSRSSADGRIEPLMQEMVKKGLSISKGSAGMIRSRLNEDEATDTVLTLLDTLASGNLTYQPLPSLPRELASSQQNISQLEIRIQELEKQNQPTVGLLTNLLAVLSRNGDVEKAEEVMKKLDTEEYKYGIGMYALLIDMYTRAGNLDQASGMLAAMLENHPDARLTPSKFLRLGQLLVQHGQIDEAVKLIETHGLENPDAQPDSIALQTQARRVLEPIVEKGNVSETRRLIDTLIASRVVQPSNHLFGQLIKAYLVNDDLDGALEEFEKICREQKATPYKNELTAKCISLEDGDRLQKILDLSIEVHGELNSLYDMVFSFIEADRVTQARKLLNTPGLRAHNEKLDRTCSRYVDQDKIKNLENLVAATKNVFDVDRNMLFTHLFHAYKKQDDCDKALGIWTSMQEENLQPSEALLRDLGTFLKNHGKEVPFIIPDPPEPKPEPKPKAELKAEPKATPDFQPQTSNNLTHKGEFRRAVKNKNFSAALELKKKIEESGTRLSIQDQSTLIESMVQAGEISEAARVTQEMLMANSHPLPRILKFLILNMARLGDVDGLLALQKYMDEAMIKRMSFSNHLADSYRATGRWQEVLEGLRAQLKDTKDTQLLALDERTPFGSIMGILQDESNSYQLVADLSEEFAARGLVGLANCLWMHNVLEGRYAEAEEIYTKHLTNSPRLLFRGVLRNAKQQGDPEVVEKMMEVVGSHPALTTPAKAFIYSTWLDILGEKQEFSKGLEVLKSALSVVTLEDLKHTSLVKLKAGVEAAGNTFDFMIPPKTARKSKAESSSSSSSSSDSD